MTTEDLEIIRRVAKIHGFFVREANPEECQQLAIYNDSMLFRSDFAWYEDEGFDAFFKQVYEFGYKRGHDAASSVW